MCSPLSSRAERSGTEAVGLLDCSIKCLIVSPLIHSVCLEEDVSWAVERWAEGGWRREGSLSKGPPPPSPPLSPPMEAGRPGFE